MAITTSGQLAGVCLNGVQTRQAEEMSDPDHQGDYTNVKFKKILQLLTTINKRSGVFTLYPTADKLLDIVILSVDVTVRGQGICKALIERTK